MKRTIKETKDGKTVEHNVYERWVKDALPMGGYAQVSRTKEWGHIKVTETAYVEQLEGELIKMDAKMIQENLELREKYGNWTFYKTAAESNLAEIKELKLDIKELKTEIEHLKTFFYCGYCDAFNGTWKELKK